MELRIDRRTLLATATGALLARPAQAAPARKTLALELIPAELMLLPGRPPSKVWRFASDVPRLTRGDEVDVTVTNRLPVPVMLIWRGLGGQPAVEPWLSRGPIAPGASANYALSLRHAGTMLCDARALPAYLPLPVLPLIVSESDAARADTDAVFLIEDWRVRPDGTVLPPGVDAAGSETVYSINGTSAVKLAATDGSPLRIRVINGAQRIVLAVQFTNAEVRVIAIDGQPSEPFSARDGRLVLAPGTRIDALVALSAATGAISLNDGARTVKLGDITASGPAPTAVMTPPLPSNGLPEKLALQFALRVTLDLDGKAGWIAPDAMSAKAAPGFKVACGRPVVLALTNPSETAVIFHLHGHHMRLLDRLDDGWKPFWLDTVAVPGKQTVRVAFGATDPGAYLVEAYRAEWNSPRLLRSYLVEG